MTERIVSDPFTVSFIQMKARQLCRRGDFSRSDYEDLCQGMRLYLLEKAHLFDAERGHLEAFVTNALKTWVAMKLRYRNRGKRSESYKALSLEGTPVECDGDVTSLAAVLLEEDGRRRTQTDPISPLEQLELREAIEQAIGSLEPADRAILTKVLEGGQSAAAKALGISWRQVANAMARIRSHFAQADLGPHQAGRVAGRGIGNQRARDSSLGGPKPRASEGGGIGVRDVA